MVPGVPRVIGSGLRAVCYPRRRRLDELGEVKAEESDGGGEEEEGELPGLGVLRLA